MQKVHLYSIFFFSFSFFFLLIIKRVISYVPSKSYDFAYERGENQFIPCIAPAAPQLFRVAVKREKNNAIETCITEGELPFSITFPDKVEMITR